MVLHKNKVVTVQLRKKPFVRINVKLSSFAKFNFENISIQFDNLYILYRERARQSHSDSTTRKYFNERYSLKKKILIYKYSTVYGNLVYSKYSKTWQMPPKLF